MMAIPTALIVSIHSEQKENLNHIRVCERTIIIVLYCLVKRPEAHRRNT